jgi:hypothetical protein
MCYIIASMKKEITISHLVVNGCSFTYCEGLENPSTQGWPTLLAKKLNVPVVNLAMGGTGNHRIYRKTVDYFFKDTESNPFYLIGMTSCTRMEQYSRHISDYVAINIVGKHYTQLWENQFVRLMQKGNDPLILAKAKLDIWLSIINLFKSTDTNYLMTDMLVNGPEVDDELSEMYPKLFDYTINDPNHAKDYVKHTSNLGKLPCNHYDAEAQIKISEYLYQELTARYIVNPVSTDYLKLKDFYTESETNYISTRKKGDWII